MSVTIRNEETAIAVCESIANGESLRKICSWFGMPSTGAILKWVSKDEQFRCRYVAAREAQAELFADETVDIADHGCDDVLVDNAGIPILMDGKTIKTKTNVSVQHAKLRVDARKWKAARMSPKRWGDKVQTEITSGGKPIKNEYHIHPVTNGKD